MGQALDQSVIDAIEFREIGPAAFGGRITDIALVPGKPFSFYVAGATGGLFKTVNNGVTWECIWQNGGSIAIGDLAVDPSNPEILWIGTGEANNQRSGYGGDGVYKTTDGGKTWANVGLRGSDRIARIVVDPRDSNIVFVASMGPMYTTGGERGLYRTTDGGATWTRVLFVDDRTGATDVVIDPTDSNIVYAATLDRLRRPWHYDGEGPGSGIYKSVDGGTTWTRLEGGLPSGDLDRIGLCISPKNPSVLYATVANHNARVDPNAAPDFGFKGEPATNGLRVTEVTAGSSAALGGLQVGDLVTRIGNTDLVNVWTVIQSLGSHKAGQNVPIVFTREGAAANTITIAIGGGDVERDIHGMPTRIIGGEIYRTADAGATWTRQNDQPVGGSPPYYYGQIRVDPNDENQIYVLSVPLMASSDGGKTWNNNVAGSLHVDHHALEIDPGDSNRLILGNDGGLGISYDRGATWDHYTNLPLAQFYAVGVDMQVPYHVYGGTQDNGTWGGPSHSRGGGIGNAEWYPIGGGDGFYAQIDPTDPDTVYAESQFGAIYRLDKRTGRSTSIRPAEREGDEPYRFNWNSPILISHHNPQIIYFGGNRVFKSFNRGDTWPVRSHDLTTADPTKIQGNVPHCTITTIAESPIDPNLIIVGTDDGLVQLSADAGVSWTNLAGRFPGAPTGWWVSRVELSRHDVNVAYVTINGYREDDDRPLVYRSADKGQTWVSISGNLPVEAVNVIREDPRNPSVLWLGTDLGAYVSIDSGATWTELTKGLPTTPVHDLVVHPRDRDLVLATHGRGFFIADVAPIQELSEEARAASAHLFTIEPAYQWTRRFAWGFSGERGFSGRNAPDGAIISYRLAQEAPEGGLSLVIENQRGEIVRTLDAPRTAGLHRLSWDFRGDPPQRGEGAQDNQRQGRRRGGRGGAPFLGPGEYAAVLTLGDRVMRETFEVRRDPLLPGNSPSIAPPQPWEAPDDGATDDEPVGDEID